jgi:hypothetical protein
MGVFRVHCFRVENDYRDYDVNNEDEAEDAFFKEFGVFGGDWTLAEIEEIEKETE